MLTSIMPLSEPVKVAIVHHPEDDELAKEVADALKPLQSGGLIRIRISRENTGRTFEQNMGMVLRSDLVLFLLSSRLIIDPDFPTIAEAALTGAGRRSERIVPVPIEPCFLEYTPLAGLKVVPGEPALSSSTDKGAWRLRLTSAINEIAKGIRFESEQPEALEASVIAMREELQHRSGSARPMRERFQEIVSKNRTERRLAPGDVLTFDEKPRYRLVAEITPPGGGRLTQVWDAYDDVPRVPVVVKTLNVSATASDAVRVSTYAPFYRCQHIESRRESAIVRRMENPRREQGVHYYVMPRLVRGTLAAAVRDGNILPVRHLASILTRVADAIDELHEYNLVHSAISPECVLLDESNHAFLGGLDALVWAQEPEIEEFTRAGTLASARPEPRSPADDVRALASLANRMLRHLERKVDAQDILQKARNGQYPVAAAFAAELVERMTGTASRRAGEGPEKNAGHAGKPGPPPVATAMPPQTQDPPAETAKDARATHASYRARYKRAGCTAGIFFAVLGGTALLARQLGSLPPFWSPGSSSSTSDGTSGTGAASTTTTEVSITTSSSADTTSTADIHDAPPTPHRCAAPGTARDALKDPLANPIGKLAVLPGHIVASAGSISTFKKDVLPFVRDGAPRGELVSDYGHAMDDDRNVLQVWSQRYQGIAVVHGGKTIATLPLQDLAGVAVAPSPAEDAIDVMYATRRSVSRVRLQVPSGKPLETVQIQPPQAVAGEIFLLSATRDTVAWVVKKDRQDLVSPSRSYYLRSEVRILDRDAGAAAEKPAVFEEAERDVSAVLPSGKKVYWAVSGGYARTFLGDELYRYAPKCDGAIRVVDLACKPGQACSREPTTLPLRVRQQDGTYVPLEHVRPLGLAVSTGGEPIYWANACGEPGVNGKLKLYASWLDGQTVLVEEDRGYSDTSGIPMVLDGDALYWAITTSSPSSELRAMIRRAQPACK